MKPEKRIRVRAIVSEMIGTPDLRSRDITRCFLVALDNGDYFFYRTKTREEEGESIMMAMHDMINADRVTRTGNKWVEHTAGNRVTSRCEDVSSVLARKERILSIRVKSATTIWYKIPEGQVRGSHRRKCSRLIDSR